MNDKTKEINAYKKWYEEIDRNKKMYVKIESKKDIIEIQNFFLICQRMKQNGYTEHFHLDIYCKKEDVFRITHFLYIAKYNDMVEKITINGNPITDINALKFYKRIPLLLLNSDMYTFLGKKIEKITLSYSEESFFSEKMEKKIQEKIKEQKDEKKHDDIAELLLIKICINNLLGEVSSGTKCFSIMRRDYFLNPNFHRKIKDMPFLACLILSISIRAQNIDKVEIKKNKIKKEKNQKSARITKEMFSEVFLSDLEIENEIFNAWDISDGILQLIENVILHASSKNSSHEEQLQNGEGVFSMCLHKNDVISEENNKEFNENSELFTNYRQYFRGYLNEYIDGEFDEAQELKKSQGALLKNLKKGLYVDGIFLQKYENVRRIIEKRRKERQESNYFLELQIADFSGKNMCDVFRKNLKIRNDPNQGKFDNISVRSFFDPAKRKIVDGKEINEVDLWEKYYVGDNAIRHFGLQIFLSIISDNRGYFEVKSYQEDGSVADFYSNAGSEDSFSFTLPGTAYNILLPMRYNSRTLEQQNTFLNTDINYKFSELNSFILDEEEEYCIKSFFIRLNDINLNIEKKMDTIESLKNYIVKRVNIKKILIFDCNQIDNINRFEIFVRTIILLLANKDQKKSYDNIAIVNCNENAFVNIIRYFLIYYDKNGMCEWMANKQLYLCGQNSIEEFIISGKNIQEMLGRVEQLAFSRRLHPRCLPMLTRMLKKRIGKGKIEQDDSRDFSFTPFDLIVKNDKGQTIFEQNVLKVLEENIQMLESGCKIEPTHMRIGSKIHMHAFYEAELLFFNNYYVNRFAYLLAQRINALELSCELPIWIIGYEAYSEMLICRLKQYMQDEGKYQNIEYSIYENSRGDVSNQEENFRYFGIEKISELIDKKAQTLLVVPINSTLTTFNKLENVVNRKCKEIVHNCSIDVRAYLGIIQVRDLCKKCDEKVENKYPLSDMEKRYWNSINLDCKCIGSTRLLRSGKSMAFYLVLAEAKWEDPLECNRCYPPDCLMEMPLIETDRASVVPTQLIGLKKDADLVHRDQKYVYSSAGDIESLRNYFYFDHVERGSNHYQIYIRTANYYADKSKEVNEWLKNTVKNAIARQRGDAVISFSVLVNPLHFSNAAFVEAVNEIVFGGASYALRIEVDREYRDNVETKFSDLELLYKNLEQMKIPAEINVYYVDDSINLGGNYTRMKHVVSSLFPQSAVRGKESVNVNIFKAVIVMINRLSAASIRNYVYNTDDYFYYLDLRISSMRTHEDACYLCKEAINSEKISRASATNQMSSYWKEQKRKYRKKSLYEAKKYKEKLEQKDRKYYERFFRRITCTHKLSTELLKLGNKINEPLAVLSVVNGLILQKKDDEFVEYLMAYLYAYATPFISYRKSCREGALTLIIILLECIIVKADGETLIKRLNNFDEEYLSQKEYVKECIGILERTISKIRNINLSSKIRYELVKWLMKLSAELKSNYILREDRISEIENFIFENINEEEIERFNVYYVALMKKILTLNADESKSARFDNMLKTHSESIIKQCQNSETVKKLLLFMYLENTIGLRRIINWLNLGKVDKSAEFLENNEIYNFILKVNGVDKPLNFIEKLMELNKLFLDQEVECLDSSKKYISFYEKMCEHIAKLLDAKMVWCAVKIEEQMLNINAENMVVYSNFDSYKTFGIFVEKVNMEEDINSIMKRAGEGWDFTLDTFYYDCQNVSVLIRYKIVLGDNSNGEEVIIGLKFRNDNYEKVMQKIKFIMLYREEILSKFSNDLNNNILQEWIEKNRILDQLKKARANSHTDEDNIFDNKSVWTLSEGFLFGDEEVKEVFCEKNHDKMRGCILGLMMNIRIGRTNVLLLSKGDFTQEELYEEQQFGYMKCDILAIKNIYFYERLEIFSKDKKSMEDSIFPDDIYSSIMEKGKEGHYLDFKSYLLYFIFEIFHSAVVNGKEVNGKVRVTVYRDGQYLFFENEVKSTFKKINIERGLRREEAGISLATICDFFIYNYTERYVKLLIENNTFAIGLPIFKV